MKKAFLFILCLITAVLSCGCKEKVLYKETQAMMGTFVEVASPYKEAPGIAFQEIKRVEGLLSKYDKDSEVSKLNKLGRLRVSPDTFYVLKEAKEFSRLTNGGFDVTVGPLMDLWGFTDKNYRAPAKEEIQRTISLVGSDKIILNSDNNVVEFMLSGMRIDLGAIAKGYAVDCAVNKLKKRGIKSCLINAGGDIYCLGMNFGRPWNVAIQDPRNKGTLNYLQMKDSGVATSGDYEQYFMDIGKRYAHILNPATGYPADSGVISVTVVAPDCLTADALATSIFVLGKRSGLKLAKGFKDVNVEIMTEKDVPHNS
jgi:FAD:protein FMN transferase